MSGQEELPAAALAQCPNPERIRHILRECYSWLAADGENRPTLSQRQDWGWAPAYSLVTWKDFPGPQTVGAVILNRATWGLVGGGGPAKDSAFQKEAKQVRAFWRKLAADRKDK